MIAKFKQIQKNAEMLILDSKEHNIIKKHIVTRRNNKHLYWGYNKMH